jgi:hypothetical protein
LPCHGFSHFAESAALRDFTRPSMPMLDVKALAAHTHASENPHEYGVFHPPMTGRNAPSRFY